MTSLRVALKLSMAEVKPDEKSHKRKNPMLHDKPVEEPSLDDILSGRKRRASFESKDSKGRSLPKNRSGRSGSPADESLTGRSEGSGYYAGENMSVISEEPRKMLLEDHESIASGKGDDASIADEGNDMDFVPVSSGIVPLQGDNDDHEKQLDHTDGKTAALADPSGDGDADLDADNEGDGEAASPKASKKRRKRTSSILKSLELIGGEELPVQAGAPDEEAAGAPRYQSSRAAAMVAKTKISAKSSAVRSSSVEDLTEPGATLTAVPLRRRKSSGTVVAVGPELNWVQCDRCEKWRSVAEHVNHSALPEQWFCEMNTWDLHLNSCEAAEQTEPVQTAAPAAGKARGARAEEAGEAEPGADGAGKRVWVKAGHGGRGRWKRTAEGEEGEEEDGEGGDGGEGGDEPSAGIASRRRSAGGAMGPGNSPRAGTGAVPLGRNTSAGTGAGAGAGGASAQAGEAAAAVNWVQCNKCRKWRKVPETIDVDALPERWYCSLNTWNPAVARCGAKQEADDVTTTSAGAAAEPAQGTKGVNNRGRRAQGAMGMGDFAPPGTIKKVSWVQCERRNCKKWRKVPAHIDPDLFPEKWYCEMNTWDLDSATCDAPEPSDSENEQPGSAASRQQLILGNSKSANALSYRRIIFGTDGRIRVCFSDKNKTGYGIFSYAEAHKPSNDADDYTAPTRRVGYWWSGAYDETAGMAAAQGSHGTGGRGNKKATASAVPESTDLPGGAKLGEAQGPPPPTYLLDTARRLGGITAPPPAFTWPKKLCKSWTILSAMPLFRRQALEGTVVMSCFMAASASSLLFSRLLSLIGSCRFPDPEVEACRAYMNIDVMKATVKRLEDKGLVSVSYASAGQLSVEVLPAVSQLSLNCTSKSVPAVAAATGVSAAWAKQGLPLKLRKFHADSKYKAGALPTSSAVTATAVESAAVGMEARAGEVETSTLAPHRVVLGTVAAPVKPFRLQHGDKWAAAAATTASATV